MVDRHFLQHNAELLSGLDGEEIESLALVAHEFGFRPGEFLFRQGEQARHVFIVYAGRIELAVPLQVKGEEREVAIEELDAGMTVAWSALVEPHIFTASARASRASELIGFARGDLQTLFASRPQIGWRAMANLARVVSHRLDLTKALWLRELQRTVTEKYG